MLQWHPHQFGGIVVGLGLCIVRDVYLEEHVDGMDNHLGVEVLVGEGEEITDLADGEARLLQYLAAHAVLYGLLHVNETAGQVQRVLGRFLAATGHQQFAFVITDKGGSGRTGVGIIGEAAGLALLALEVVYLKCLAAANGAILKFV